MTIAEFVASLPEDKKISESAVRMTIKRLNFIQGIDYKRITNDREQSVVDLSPTGVEKLLNRNTQKSGRPRKEKVEKPKNPVGRPPKGKPGLVDNDYGVNQQASGNFIIDELLRDKDKV